MKRPILSSKIYYYYYYYYYFWGSYYLTTSDLWLVLNGLKETFREMRFKRLGRGSDMRLYETERGMEVVEGED